MIDIITEQDRNLKNLKQIGTPREENKIYIESFAYAKLKEPSLKEKRVFVLMGHTERMEGKYATFVEAVIPVKEIEFLGGVPRWSNTTWSEVFREIKRIYEDMIIVGWAIDVKGMSLRMSPELERVHREHFGGVHQLLLLMDTLEQEERFFMYKENKVVEKDGFYIYHRARKREEFPLVSEKTAREDTVLRSVKKDDEKEIDLKVDVPEIALKKSGRYRQLMQEAQVKKTSASDGGNIGLAIAVAMLLLVIGMGIYDNRGNIFGQSDSVQTNAQPKEVFTEEGIMIEDVNETENSEDFIPVEVIEGETQE